MTEKKGFRLPLFFMLTEKIFCIVFERLKGGKMKTALNWFTSELKKMCLEKLGK